MAVPVVSSISPSHGLPGDTIALAGSGFATATDVQVGTTSCPTFSASDDNNMTCEVPVESPGNACVQVFNPEGFSECSFPENVYTIDGDPPPPPGEEPCITVEVPTLLADGSTADGDGIVYTVEAVDGWYDSIPMRSALLEAQPRGETIVVAHEGGRTIDVKITAHSAVAGEALGAILCFTATYTIKTAFRAVFVPISFRVVDAYADRTLLARRIGPIKESILGNSAAVTFSIPMLGEDPRRFAT